jgi:ABC-type phosphate transport system substrate-binding protein
MKKIILAFSLLLSFSSQAGIAIIANKSVTADLSATQLAQLYTNRANDLGFTPVNQSETSIGIYFHDNVVKKSPSQMKAFWSKLVFTGKGTPPKEFASDEEVLAFVSSTPGAIGYVDDTKVNDSVRVIKKY